MSPLNIDRLSGVPIYAQLVAQVEKRIAAGILRPGEQIPSVRALSLELSVNPNTIQKAYAELEAAGITASVPGVGRFVARGAPERLAQRSRGELGELREKLCGLALAGVPEKDVLALVREAYSAADTAKKAEKRSRIDQGRKPDEKIRRFHRARQNLLHHSRGLHLRSRRFERRGKIHLCAARGGDLPARRRTRRGRRRERLREPRRQKPPRARAGRAVFSAAGQHEKDGGSLCGRVRPFQLRTLPEADGRLRPGPEKGRREFFQRHEASGRHNSRALRHAGFPLLRRDLRRARPRDAQPCEESNLRRRLRTENDGAHHLAQLAGTGGHLRPAALLHKGGLVFESDIANLKTSLFKIQVAFAEDYGRERFGGIEVLSFSKKGAVANLIVRGDREQTVARLQGMHPLLLEILPLTLEEVFIYEMDALGYAFKDVLDEGGDCDAKKAV